MRSCPRGHGQVRSEGGTWVRARALRLADAQFVRRCPTITHQKESGAQNISRNYIQLSDCNTRGLPGRATGAPDAEWLVPNAAFRCRPINPNLESLDKGHSPFWEIKDSKNGP
ncbi:hypothetical protein CHARACLAT_005216 [Characodon lateralis]|uniref:Uncharacterized protein n=1 Tax=Characodon lateralis TaxID=208331 RepID=A0ABU7EI88_9TELE|nr:hypothetical protein [Characodon lateralis]